MARLRRQDPPGAAAARLTGDTTAGWSRGRFATSTTRSRDADRAGASCRCAATWRLNAAPRSPRVSPRGASARRLPAWAIRTWWSSPEGARVFLPRPEVNMAAARQALAARSCHQSAGGAGVGRPDAADAFLSRDRAVARVDLPLGHVVVQFGLEALEADAEVLRVPGQQGHEGLAWTLLERHVEHADGALPWAVLRRDVDGEYVPIPRAAVRVEIRRVPHWRPTLRSPTRPP
jgi:hypothetical protein